MHPTKICNVQLCGAAIVLLLCAACDSKSTTEREGDVGFVRVDEVQAAELPAEPTPAASASESTTGALVPEPAAAETELVEAAAPEPLGVPAQRPTSIDTSDEAAAVAAIEAANGPRAVELLSRLILTHLQSGADDRAQLARWTALLRRAQVLHRWSRNGAWKSMDVVVHEGDSLIAIRKRALAAHPGAILCTGQIAKANGLASETAIRPKDRLRVPLESASMLVDLSAMWALYMVNGEVVDAWEVGVGKAGSDSRPGSYSVGLKQKDPMWSPVGREPVPFGDPENPLGTRWLAWFEDGKPTTLGFHGTNDPTSVGRRVSEGCIRLRNEDVEVLYDILPIGAAVEVVP